MVAVEKEAGAAAAAVDDAVNIKEENAGKAAAADAPKDGVANGEAEATPAEAENVANPPKLPPLGANAAEVPETDRA